MITSELDSGALRPLRSPAGIPYHRLSRDFLRAASRNPGVLRSQALQPQRKQYLYEFPGDLTHSRGEYPA